MVRGADYPYTSVMGREVFRELSKDTLAAIVVSLLTGGGDRIGTVDVPAAVASEVDALAAAGIVPRRLPARFARPAGDSQ